MFYLTYRMKSWPIEVNDKTPIDINHSMPSVQITVADGSSHNVE